MVGTGSQSEIIDYAHELTSIESLIIFGLWIAGHVKRPTVTVYL